MSLRSYRRHPSSFTEPSAGCHTDSHAALRRRAFRLTAGVTLPRVVIVGQPNVGKSLLFNRLTGAYVTVSNYPGTTVEVVHGVGRLPTPVDVIDTPGMYRLLPITDEERVARDILLRDRPSVVVHVVDAKNLDRMLPMTLQLLEAGLPVIVALNLVDEAERLGVRVNVSALEQALGVPVVATAAVTGRGLAELQKLIAGRVNGLPATGNSITTEYPPMIERALDEITARLDGAHPLRARAMALLLFQGDSEISTIVREKDPQAAARVREIADASRAQLGRPASYLVASHLRERVQQFLPSVVTPPSASQSGFAARLNAAMIAPLTGIPLLLVSLFLLYEFVGVLGAQTLVDVLENGLFGRYVNPWVEGHLAAVPWPGIRELIGGQYGVVTMGARYAVAIILPIVGTFFVAFSIIEDSGYLPRLAMLIDRVFKKIGLNGRAVIPMVLGFGCDTMATIVTRTLETRRERILSTLLLALAIPCSAQLGVMLGLLGGRPGLLVAWTAILTAVFLLAGFLAAKVLPGQRPMFYMELPPLRVPTLANVLVKTYTRMEWYFREVFPVFILASVLIWVGRMTGLFDLLVSGLVPVVRWLGLPDASAVAFLFGFFRRDYGAAGLYDLRGSMTGVQLLVSTTTLTLFVPCIAQFSVMLEERGWKTALAIDAFVFPFAFLVGGAVNWILQVLGGPR